MPNHEYESKLLVEQLSNYLKMEGYCTRVKRHYEMIAGLFLVYIASRKRAIEIITKSDIEQFLQQQLRLYRKRNHRTPANIQKWRCLCTRPVHILLRLVRGKWPDASPPETPLQAFHQELVQDYDTWMRDLRGLASVTRLERTSEARRFLDALGLRGDQANLMRLTARSPQYRRRARGLRR